MLAFLEFTQEETENTYTLACAGVGPGLVVTDGAFAYA